MSSLGKDIAGEIGALYALASTAATAGGSGDNTEITGATINTATVFGVAVLGGGNELPVV